MTNFTAETRSAFAKHLRDLADGIERLPDSPTSSCHITATVGVMCESVDEFRRLARAAGLTLNDRPEYDRFGPNLSLHRNLVETDHGIVWIYVSIDAQKVAVRREVQETRTTWDAHPNLLTDDYEPPKEPTC